MLTNAQLDQLLDDGFIVLDDVLQASTFLNLQTEARRQVSYRDAKIVASASDDGLAKSIRSDSIAWIEADRQMPQGERFLALLAELKAQLNRAFFAGIRRIEAHYACYAQGSFYARHIDNPKGQDSRVFSCVFYLNDNWTERDGGQLVIYPNNHTPSVVLPKGNRAVIFDSNIAHEVKTAQRARYSIAAWFRRDDG